MTDEDVNLYTVFRCDGSVSVMEFGPYDNGMIILGTTKGEVLMFEPMNLNMVFKYSYLMNHTISSITFQPLNYIHISSLSGEIKLISLEKQKYHYIYTDHG